MSKVKIKICGITNEKDAALAAALGADAIGLNFYSKSPRNVGISAARDILRLLPQGIETIAIFVDETPDFIASQLLHLPRIKAVQWYAEISALLLSLPLPTIPAFSVEEQNDLVRISRYLAEARARGTLPTAILVDGHASGLYGGTGRKAPWRLLANFHPGVPLYLAGGLTPENVAEAIRLVQPHAVDVASGVEKSPGIKDPAKLRRFIEAVRT
jgi:phosphoribosylanthranilate isomerase